MELIENDTTKFFNNGNKAAGTRARKHLQELKQLCQVRCARAREARRQANERARWRREEERGGAPMRACSAEHAHERRGSRLRVGGRKTERSWCTDSRVDRKTRCVFAVMRARAVPLGLGDDGVNMTTTGTARADPRGQGKQNPSRAGCWRLCGLRVVAPDYQPKAGCVFRPTL